MVAVLGEVVAAVWEEEVGVGEMEVAVVVVAVVVAGKKQSQQQSITKKR